jgi:hypothetical protein
VLCNYMQNFHKLSDTKQRPYQLWQSRIVLHSIAGRNQDRFCGWNTAELMHGTVPAACVLSRMLKINSGEGLINS